MPLNGSGQMVRPYSWANEANIGNNIDPAKMDQDADGFAQAISTSIMRDGQSTVTSAIPWNNQKITGLGDATAAQDALNQRTGDGRYTKQFNGALSPAVSVVASTIDLTTSRYFYKTASAGLTWVFSAPVLSGFVDGFILELSNGGIGTQTWPASARWSNGVAPSLTVSGTDILVFITRDGGLTWRGSLSQRNSS